MNTLFPYDHVVVGVLIFIVGFIFHWVGQLISIMNWKFASRIGLQESNLPKEYKVYEQAIAVADSLLGWVYGLAAVGLILDASWGYKLAWFPGVVLVYHSLSFWFWTRNRNKDGNSMESKTMRIGWALANFSTGLLTILLAWNGVNKI